MPEFMTISSVKRSLSRSSFQRLACIIFSITSISAPASAYTIVASIKPIAGVAKAIAGKAATVQLLVDGRTSAHDATLKPSHISKISQADAILMVSRDFETFLTKPLDKYAKRKDVIEMTKVEGVKVLPAEISFANPVYDWRKDTKTPKDILGTDNPQDYHVWLEPKYIQALAKRVRDLLSAEYPQHQNYFNTNYLTFLREVGEADAANRAALRSYNGSAFVSAHGGYQYFRNAYGLNQVGTIALGSTHQTDPARLKALQTAMREGKAHCIIRDSEYKGRAPEQLASATDSKVVTADPIGVSIPLDAHFYPNLLRRLGQSFTSCLAATGR